MLARPLVSTSTSIGRSTAPRRAFHVPKAAVMADQQVAELEALAAQLHSFKFQSCDPVVKSRAFVVQRGGKASFASQQQHTRQQHAMQQSPTLLATPLLHRPPHHPAPFSQVLAKGSAEPAAGPSRQEPTFITTFSCPYAQRSWIALNAKGIKYNTVLVDL